MPTPAACRLRDGPRMSGSYNADRPDRSRGDPEPTVVAERDGGAAQQGGQAIDGRCVIGDRLGWGNRCRPPAGACRVGSGEPALLLGQVRGQAVDRLAGARRMSIRAPWWPGRFWAPRS